MRGLAMGLAPRLAPRLAAVAMMARPPAEPPPTLSTGLLVVDGAVCVLYSLSASISHLFTSGEYLSQSLFVTAQDMGERTASNRPSMPAAIVSPPCRDRSRLGSGV